MSRSDFKELDRKSKRIDSPALGFRVCFPENTQKSRFSAVISSKILPQAVLRNRQRRRIYSAISSLKSKIAAVNNGFLMAIYLKEGGRNAKMADFKKEISGVLNGL